MRIAFLALFALSFSLGESQMIVPIQQQNGKPKQPSVLPERLYTTHLMNALTSHGDTLQSWINYMVDSEGHNNFWLYADSWYGGTTASNVLDAIANAGATVIPGNQTSNVDPYYTTLMFSQTFSHPAIYKYNNRPVYIGYHTDGLTDAVEDSLLAYGYHRNQFEYWVYSGYYPYSPAEGGTYNLPTPIRKQDVDDLFTSRTDIDGLVNFAVDKPGNATQNVIDENTFISQSAYSNSKVAIAGINHVYASAQFSVAGFDGLLSEIKSILALPLAQWPLGICDITANDGAERTTMSRHQNSSVGGLAYVPNLSAGYTLGATFSYPLLDNSGVNKFIRPWIEKFKASDTTPVTFTTDRIFCWYLLHPIQASYVTTIPAYLNTNWPSTINGLSKSAYWATTFYAIGDSKTDELKAHMDTSYEHIRMACHLASSAVLRITIGGVNYDSPTRSAGDAYWSIPLGSKRGVPTFSIVRGGVVVKTGAGLQAITDYCWPGGWNPLITEIP